MSIKSEIERIGGNIAAAYEAAEEIGAELPAQRSSANLAQMICGLSASGPSDGERVYEAAVKSSVAAQMGSVVLYYFDADSQLCSASLAANSVTKFQTPHNLVMLECTVKGLGTAYTGIKVVESSVPVIPVSSSPFILAAALSWPSTEITVQLYKS